MNASKVTNTDVPIKKGDKWGMAFGTICTQPVFDELYISSEEYARGRIGEDCLTSLQKELPLEVYNRILLNTLCTHGNT